MSRQEAPHGGGQIHCADGEDHIVMGIHAPLTCYCELPAVLADNCHSSLGKRSQRQTEGQTFCICCSSLPCSLVVLILPLSLVANVFSIWDDPPHYHHHYRHGPNQQQFVL